MKHQIDNSTPGYECNLGICDYTVSNDGLILQSICCNLDIWFFVGIAKDYNVKLSVMARTFDIFPFEGSSVMQSKLPLLKLTSTCTEHMLMGYCYQSKL